MWDEGQCRIFGVDPNTFTVTAENVRALLHPEDLERLEQVLRRSSRKARESSAKTNPNNINLNETIAAKCLRDLLAAKTPIVIKGAAEEC